MTKCTIDDTYTVQNTATIDTMYNMYLFAMRSTNTAKLDHLATTKIYYCKIWDNDTLVRNFIPCINDNNVIGMYDTVNSVFYSPSGTGSFRGGRKSQSLISI